MLAIMSNVKSGKTQMDIYRTVLSSKLKMLSENENKFFCSNLLYRLVEVNICVGDGELAKLFFSTKLLSFLADSTSNDKLINYSHTIRYEKFSDSSRCRHSECVML